MQGYNGFSDSLFVILFFFFLQFKRLEFFELATGSMRGNELLAVRAF